MGHSPTKMTAQNESTVRTYQISVSTTESTSKPKGAQIAALKFRTLNVTSDELVGFIKKGHTLCHVFKHDGEVFGIRQKTQDNFLHANMVMIDVDDSVVDMQTLCDSLPVAPSIAFTTYSNGVKGFRFRLIYLFDEVLTETSYISAYREIIARNGLTLKDDCMKTVAQCSFTNGSKDVEVITNEVSYKLSDFGIDGRCKNDNLQIIKEKTTHTLLALGCQECTYDNGILADLKNMKWSEFVIECKGKYGEIIEHSPLEYNEDGYALLDDSYIEIYRRWYLDFYEVNGEERRSPRLKTMRDGDRRHYKLWLTAVLRRRIKPSITFDELLFNTVTELVHHYDNSDGKFTLKNLVDLCRKVLAMTEEELNQMKIMKDKRRYRIDPTVYTTKEARQHARRAVKRLITDRDIQRHYDVRKSDKENLAILEENGVKISRQRLTQYKSANGLKSMTKGEKIKGLFREDLPDKENLRIFKENGLSVSLRTLKQWRKENGYAKRCKIDNLQTIKENNTNTLLALGCQECTFENTEVECETPNMQTTQLNDNEMITDENKVNEPTNEDIDLMKKTIAMLDKRYYNKKGYTKRFPTLQDFFKPLAEVWKECESVEAAQMGLDYFNDCVENRDLNYPHNIDTKITIDAFRNLAAKYIAALQRKAA